MSFGPPNCYQLASYPQVINLFTLSPLIITIIFAVFDIFLTFMPIFQCITCVFVGISL
ncbi:hypothetical protein SA21259_0705 [Staphylococcus aureus subsp. aureus 21259]|nr:hypothetical protein SA21259_0705 [Staphylococcus aureus subsp. aureus 21259]